MELDFSISAVRSLFAGLVRSFRSYNSQTIRVSPGLNFIVPNMRVRVISRAFEVIHNADLSVAETRQIFIRMRTACEKHEIQKFNMGSLSWTIDAHIRDPDAKIVITIRSESSLHTQWVSRQDIIGAADEFSAWLDRVSFDVCGRFP